MEDAQRIELRFTGAYDVIKLISPASGNKFNAPLLLPTYGAIANLLELRIEYSDNFQIY